MLWHPLLWRPLSSAEFRVTCTRANRFGSADASSRRFEGMSGSLDTLS